jgi:hypothetical protein
MEILQTYPYFFANLPTLILCVILPMLLGNRKARRTACYSGLCCMPCSLVALLHNDRYWQPVRLGHLPYGIEDLIFTYIVGVIVWMGAWLLFREKILIGDVAVPKAISRLLPDGALSGTLTVVLYAAGMDPMTVVLVVGCALAIALLIRRRSLWRLSAAGSVVFPLFYIAVVNLQFRVWPDYVLYWIPSGPWVRLFLGIPVGEVLWSVMFGALWPALVATAFGIRLRAQCGADPRTSPHF